MLMLLLGVKSMSDGFSLNLTKADMKCIADQYLYLKKADEDDRKSSSCFDRMRTFYQFDGFKMALMYVGIDPHIFDNDNTFS